MRLISGFELSINLFHIASPLESFCSALCTMDNACKSAIFDGDDKLCHLFDDSQSSSLDTSSEFTSVTYFEKADCDWTMDSSEVRQIISLDTSHVKCKLTTYILFEKYTMIQS